MAGPRVLLVFSADGTWCRSVLGGFVDCARGRDWNLLHYHPTADIDWLVETWSPAVVVTGPEFSGEPITRFGTAQLISVPVDRSEEGVASVCVDDERVAQLAAEHLLERGLGNLTTFRFDLSTFATVREAAFIARAEEAGAYVAPGWGNSTYAPAERGERPAALIEWLRSLPIPCGIFTCTDGWGRTVANWAREAGLRVPEDVAIIGANNDVLECELIAPPLSSVMIPWELVGQEAAEMARAALANVTIAGRRSVVAPMAVVARRSTDLLAVDDELVIRAVAWIRDNAERRLTVPMVARAVGGGRQRLERRFRRALERTVQDEIRRAHVERAMRLLATSTSPLSEIAKRSGFTNASLLNTAFQREVGTPPGAYRRRARRHHDKPKDE